MSIQPKWEVVDDKGDVVFDADFISKEPSVKGGLFTARAFAKRLARQNSDPELSPLKARKEEK